MNSQAKHSRKRADGTADLRAKNASGPGGGGVAFSARRAGWRLAKAAGPVHRGARAGWLFVVCLLFPALVAAQSARWEPRGGSLVRDQVAVLNLVFENCEPKGGTASLPRVDGLVFGAPTSSTESAFTFGTGQGRTSRTTFKLRYPVRPEDRAEITIPVFQVETDAGLLTVPAATFTVVDAAVGQGQTSLSEVAFSSFTLPERPVWAGEVFPLSYQISLAAGLSPKLTGNPEWDSTPLLAEPWPERYAAESTLRNGRSFAEVSYTTRAMAARDGAVPLPTLGQAVGLAAGQGIFGPSYSQYVIRTAPATLTVRPLPQPAPERFFGAVGRFTLKSKVIPEQVAVGEPVTWTIELSGTGNWPAVTALPPREVSLDFQVVQPRAQKTEQPGTLFDAALAEDVVLIPTRPGSYTLGPVEVAVFDPAAGAYQTLRTEPVVVTVRAAAGPPAGATPVAPLTGIVNGDSGVGKTPSPPEAIPQEPLPGGELAAAPVPFSLLLPGVLAAVLWPVLLWLGLAYRRARLTEPLRSRRLARARLDKTLAGLRTALANPADKDIARLLLEWQRDAARLWGLDTAAPSARDFTESRWAELWREADRVLYRRATALPADWPERARIALAAAALPRFSPFHLLLGRNLFPFFALALVVLPGTLCAAPAPENAYAAADFTGAEAGWRARVESSPRDWRARHNLSLALAQQERWTESAAWATTAFAQRPGDAAVRWQTRLALERAGRTPEPLLDGTGWKKLAGQASPAAWQAVLVTGALGLALGWAVSLVRGYGLAGRRAHWLAALPALSGVTAMLLSGVALRAYGPLADTRAAFVWQTSTLYSVPTEADEIQQTTPVAAGSMVFLGKEFLGWRQVSFDNGQTGWLRTENLVPVWQ